MDNPYPICFDTRCINNNDEYKISPYKRDSCKYTICSNGVDINNLIVGGTSSFINIITNTNCSNYNVSDDLKTGNYNISFINDNIKYNWIIGNDNKITTDINKIQLFRIIVNNNILKIEDIYFKNGILTYEKNKYNEFFVSLDNDKIFLIDKLTGSPIIKYKNLPNIFNHLPQEINDIIFYIVLENK
jgi:hypothetical protein